MLKQIVVIIEKITRPLPNQSWKPVPDSNPKTIAANELIAMNVAKNKANKLTYLIAHLKINFTILFYFRYYVNY